MFSALKSFFAPNGKVSATNNSVRFEMSAPGWKHFRSDAVERIESFKAGRHVLNVNVRKYIRSDGNVPNDEMVRDSVVTLSRGTPTEIFKAGEKWIGHYKSGTPDCEVDNWHMAALSAQSELMVATVIVMFTDDSLRAEIRTALLGASLIRL